MSSCPALQGWRAQQLTALRRHSALIDVMPPAQVASSADRVRPFVLVVSGRLTVVGENRVSTLVAGGCWGADALLGADPHPETVHAMDPSRLLVIGPGEFATLMHTVAAFAALVARDLARRARPCHTG